MQPAKEAASRVTDQVRQKTDELAGQAQETVKTTANKQKGRVVESMGTIADALRQTGDQLDKQDQGSFANVAHMAADRLEQFSTDLQNKSVDQIVGEVENFARRDPQLFLGGAVLLGLLASRFFKSSANRQQQQQGYYQQGPQYRYGGRYPSQGYYESPGRRFDESDLADYRNETVRSQYAGTPGRRSYEQGQSGMDRPSSQAGSQTNTGATGYVTNPGTGSSSGSSTTNPDSGMGTQGHNMPPSTKPGERPGTNLPRRSDE